MYSPGLDLHEWESEWEALEEDLRTDPARILPSSTGSWPGCSRRQATT